MAFWKLQSQPTGSEQTAQMRTRAMRMTPKPDTQVGLVALILVVLAIVYVSSPGDSASAPAGALFVA